MTSILGISAFYHDSAAALIIDGKIIINGNLILRKRLNDFIDTDKKSNIKRIRKYINDKNIELIFSKCHMSFSINEFFAFLISNYSI